jgi:hypothetical protein
MMDNDKAVDQWRGVSHSYHYHVYDVCMCLATATYDPRLTLGYM